MANAYKKPYLVIPKLIDQPTWGGSYIAQAKGWDARSSLIGKKIGQSYELFDKSNLSTLTASTDPLFQGELADPKLVQEQSHPDHSVPITELISENPEAVLGKKIVKKFGPVMPLLLKFTQALGNSFQLHVPDGTKGTSWKPKPESWYFFEPGYITCGVKPGVWEAYEKAVTELDQEISAIAAQVANGSLTYDAAKQKIAARVAAYNPWQFVHVTEVPSETLIDLSPCGIHHSWEEDSSKAPLGNVLYEIQLNVMDDVATLRSFDKGKIAKDGKLRPLQIAEYFTYADRSPEANDPNSHMRKPEILSETDSVKQERILVSSYYTMDRITLKTPGAMFEEPIDTFRHIFVRSGSVEAGGPEGVVTVTAGHSAFIPAAAGSFTLKALNTSEVLVSY